MNVFQKEIFLQPKARGFHLVTEEITKQLPGLVKVSVGIAHLFIKHTSASLTLNENADPTVRSDMEIYFDKSVSENSSYFQHTLEGADDMTSHIKSSLIGSSVTIPISNGKFNFGTWQGIYFCEHRNFGGSRKIVATIIGE